MLGNVSLNKILNILDYNQKSKVSFTKPSVDSNIFYSTVSNQKVKFCNGMLHSTPTAIEWKKTCCQNLFQILKIFSRSLWDDHSQGFNIKRALMLKKLFNSMQYKQTSKKSICIGSTTISCFVSSFFIRNCIE